MAMTPDELIDTSMMLIVHSGDARAAAFHALQEAKAGNFEEAKKLMAESKAKALEAHHIQTGLLADEGNGEGPQVNAEDYHLIGWYDSLGCAAGGKIRVLIAVKNG